ncbi:putative GPI-anchor transamidase [Cyclospora cayetanensis]|uniref:GPI-anchor transamidase n=1 Tax=Cyclospora cayetanensis TaxID=88456 RepID=A0A1D3D3A3_9EIME|nr:putative GPI-anchor transamidase [Cyclospora cayetanensis]
MLAGADGPCTARNPFPAGVYRHPSRKHNLFGGHNICAEKLKRRIQQRIEKQHQDQEGPQEQHQDLRAEIFSSRSFSKCAAGALGWEGAEVDYGGDDVTVAALLGVLTGMQPPQTPRKRRLHSDQESGVIVFLSGHGGDPFLKFSDWEVLQQQQLSDAVAIMASLGRFKRMLLIAETCQAATLLAGVQTPGVLRISSSLKGESSYSYGGDFLMGASLIDRWTHSVNNFLYKQANADFAAVAASAFSTENDVCTNSSECSGNSSSEYIGRMGVGRLLPPVSSLLESLEPSFLMSHCGVEEERVPGVRLPSLTEHPLEDFFSERKKPYAFNFRYPLAPAGGSQAAEAQIGAARPLALWSSDAIRFMPLLNALTRQQQMREQQPQQLQLFGAVSLWTAPVGVALAGIVCLATASLL